jgi:hypothetical protein
MDEIGVIGANKKAVEVVIADGPGGAPGFRGNRAITPSAGAKSLVLANFASRSAKAASANTMFAWAISRSSLVGPALFWS